MSTRKHRVLAFKIVKRLPVGLQRIIVKTSMKLRFLAFKIRLRGKGSDNVPLPSKIYWVSPERIKYHTNYIGNKNAEITPYNERVFDGRTGNMRGKVVDGNWDRTDFDFTNLDVYQAFKQRIEQGIEWQYTEFYQRVLKQVKSGRFVWSIKSRTQLDERCRSLDDLIESIKTKGYRLNPSIYSKDRVYDEIDVNIGRNGEYLFQNGVHRLSIAKILGIKAVPVTVFVRHQEWQEFREFLFSYVNKCGEKRLYQPPLHPDLEDVPYSLNPSRDIWEAIRPQLERKAGKMLDIGSNIGFFCHKFEDIGYHCYAVEQNPALFYIMEKIRVAENKRFEAINKSIFEVEFVKKVKFDVVLALNIFHHFLKSQTTFRQLEILLRNLDTDILFFEPHKNNESQMKGAYLDYSEPEFVDFVLRHTSLHKSELIHTAKDGRHVYKLSK